MTDAPSARYPGVERALAAALLVLLAVIWLEPAGSALAEPDETRYAEIPREMLAAGDLAVPRLNGVPYFEKPPLLYWANAASFRIFGQTPWAARLPTRLAGLGTLLLVVATAARRGRAAGLSAGLLLLASPMGFLLERTNLTDGPLTFFLTAALLAGRAAVLRREQNRPWMALASLTGAAAAGAFLTKGLIALALPGATLLIWALATGRLRPLFSALMLSPAPLVFVALAAPWFLLVERRHPGFLQFFFIHEHFQRFATRTARRPGPIYYFVPVFLLGFLPGVPFFFSGARRSWKREEDGFFFLLWFSVVFVFFSLSRSKLPPYLFPAIPAAAVLASFGLPADGRRRPWIIQATLATALAVGLALQPALQAEALRHGLGALIAPVLSALVVASWAAVLLSERSAGLALAAVALGWASFSAGVVFGWPQLARARFTADLARAATAGAAPAGAPIVGYRDYLNGVSWELKAPLPVAGYRGELEPDFEPRAEVRDGLFWSEEKFWARWKNGEPLVALVRVRDLPLFAAADPPAHVLNEANNHAVVANFR